jgi:ESS family glutamate:Na+ symporter
VSYLYLNPLCAKVFPQYRHEAFLSLYGMLTGTVSTGVILLREVDPRFETQAADNLVYHQPWAIVFGFPMLLLLPVAPQTETKGWVTLGIVVLLFLVMQLILFRRQIFKRGKENGSAIK